MCYTHLTIIFHIDGNSPAVSEQMGSDQYPAHGQAMSFLFYFGQGASLFAYSASEELWIRQGR